MATFDEFRQTIKNEGLVRSNRFSVFFPAPSGMSGQYSALSMRKIMMFCSHAELPGLNVSTAPIRTTGEVLNVPYDRNFNSVTMTFYADATMSVKYFFEEWINLIQDRDTRQFSYFDDYAIREMMIKVENIKNEEVYWVKLHKVYPKSISSISLGHDITGHMSVNVTFEYRYWESARVNKNGVLSRFINPSSIALAPGEQFVTIQGSNLPGIARAQNPAAAQILVSPAPSILSGVVGNLQGIVQGVTGSFSSLPNLIPAGVFDQNNANSIAGLVTKGNGLSTSVANIGTILQSQAGSNMSPVNLDGIYGALNQVRGLVASGSALAGLIANFAPSSVGNIATQLNNMHLQMDAANTKVFAANTKVNDSIIAATNAINQIGRLTAPNTPKGQ